MDSTTTHTCLEFVTTSVYFNLIGSMKVSAKPITSSAHQEESLGRAYQCHSLYICPLSRPIACCVHKPYMVHDLSFVSLLDTNSKCNKPHSGAGVSITSLAPNYHLHMGECFGNLIVDELVRN